MFSLKFLHSSCGQNACFWQTWVNFCVFCTLTISHLPDKIDVSCFLNLSACQCPPCTGGSSYRGVSTPVDGLGSKVFQSGHHIIPIAPRHESWWASQAVQVVKNLPANAGDARGLVSSYCVRKIPWRRAWQPTPVFLPGESHGQRSLVSSQRVGRDRSDLITHTHA